LVLVSQIKGISSKVWYAGGDVTTHSKVEEVLVASLLKSHGLFKHDVGVVIDT
jgi:hypothetical protein